ncbi:MAG: diacylglycerol kinase [Thermoguttaceae bacterium]|jgi:diacylglycerol kinase
MHIHKTPNERTWPEKFAHAFRGVGAAIPADKTFKVHLSVGFLSLLAAAALQPTKAGFGAAQWAVLCLCITLVLTAEMGNSALESIAKAVASEDNEHVARCLDIGAGMVLVAAFGAIAAGAILFIHQFGVLAGCW